MCGFFGEFSRPGMSSPKEIFCGLNNLATNRGPDHEGYWTNSTTCQLGFRRLSIIDLSNEGNQPMHSPNGLWSVVFNGEIYNYKELQAEMEIDKYQLHSTSDTEILVNAIQRWGVHKTAAKLNGMYAIAAYEHEADQLHLIRDFAGIKPLFYAINENRLIFGSQYDQIYSHPEFSKKEISPVGLSEYVRFGYNPAPNCIFKNTYQLNPGEIITIDSSFGVRKDFYYQIGPGANLQDETSGGALSGFHQVFSNVVNRQLVSDVEIGTFLSGGIDSPLVTAHAASFRKNLKTFTIGFEDKNYNESEIAMEYAQSLKVQNSCTRYTPQLLYSQLDNHFKAFKEPFGDYSSLPSYQLSKDAKKNFTVVLTGDGGDELFWGYPRMLRMVQHRRWFGMPMPVRRLLAKMFREGGRSISYGIHYNSIGKWVLEHHSQNKSANLDLILPGHLISEDTQEMYTSPVEMKTVEEILQWLRWNEYYGHMQRVLVKVDRTTMFHSLEARVPFLDKETIQYALTLKPGLGTKHKEPKYLLKKDLENFIPSEIINRKKYGFGLPIDDWLRSSLKEEVMDLLVNSDPYPYNTFDRKELNVYLDNFMSGKTDNGWGIWILYALQKWSKLI
jgi:asparagine synthase (glutamine-hydrolysing)